MAKWHGKVGYIVTTETSPGIFDEVPVEKHRSGEVYKNSRRLVSIGELNDKVVPSTQISFIADAFANENFLDIRYAEFHGRMYKVEDVDALQRPRLILTLGGVYNGQQA